MIWILTDQFRTACQCHKIHLSACIPPKQCPQYTLIASRKKVLEYILAAAYIQSQNNIWVYIVHVIAACNWYHMNVCYRSVWCLQCNICLWFQSHYIAENLISCLFSPRTWINLFNIEYSLMTGCFEDQKILIECKVYK